MKIYKALLKTTHSLRNATSCIYVYIYIQPLYHNNLLSMYSNQHEIPFVSKKTNGKSSVVTQETEIYFLEKTWINLPLLRMKLKAA